MQVKNNCLSFEKNKTDDKARPVSCYVKIPVIKDSVSFKGKIPVKTLNTLAKNFFKSVQSPKAKQEIKASLKSLENDLIKIKNTSNKLIEHPDINFGKFFERSLQQKRFEGRNLSNFRKDLSAYYGVFAKREAMNKAVNEKTEKMVGGLSSDKEFEGMLKLHDKFESAIRVYGLNQKEKAIVLDVESRLGVKLYLPPNSEKLAVMVDEMLTMYKNLGHKLPEKYDFVNFKRFKSCESTGLYTSLEKPGGVYFNPADINLYLKENNVDMINQVLRHETTHFWHDMALNKTLNAVSKNGFEDILSSKRYKDLYRDFKGMNLFMLNTPPKLNALNKNLDKYAKFMKHTKTLSEQDKKDTLAMVKEFKDVEALIDDVLGKRSEFKSLAKYSKTNPVELVAVAGQLNQDIAFPKAFQAILKKLKAPERKDVSFLPEDYFIKNKS